MFISEFGFVNGNMDLRQNKEEITEVDGGENPRQMTMEWWNHHYKSIMEQRKTKKKVNEIESEQVLEILEPSYLDFTESDVWFPESIEVVKEVVKNIKTPLKALVLGCGLSTLPIQLAHLSNVMSVIAIDSSQVVIEQLRLNLTQALTRIPEGNIEELLKVHKITQKIQYRWMDARNIIWEEASFDLVIDEGLIDSLSCVMEREEGRKDVFKVLTSVAKVLKRQHQGHFVVIGLDHEPTESLGMTFQSAEYLAESNRRQNIESLFFNDHFKWVWEWKEVNTHSFYLFRLPSL